MKIIRIAGIALVLLVVVVLIAGFFFVRSVARKGLPDYNQTVELSGILEEVTVYRDTFGIPHIFARNENDLYKATGYCMAQDRLWQMDLYRRVCTGRLSEIFGEDLVETDLLMRALRIPEKSRRVLEKSEKAVVDTIESFVDGVNQYIEGRGKKLPPEFIILGYRPESWQVEHSLYLIGYMAWDLTSSWNMEILLEKIRKKLGDEIAEKLLPGWDFHETFVYPEMEAKLESLNLNATLLRGNRPLRDLGLEVFSGSNNWAVSGERSVTGKPILANDMHLGLDSPGIWYQMHQVVEGELNVTGVALAGQPFVVAGHNSFIAWGFTNVMVDNLDFYLEKINPENPRQYELNGEWLDMTVKPVKISVKGGEVVEEELRFTHRGPIVSRFHELEDVAVSMRWSGNDDSNEMRTVYLGNRARNWDEFREAIRTFTAVSQNTVYADIDGNIGLYCCAGIPIRKDGDKNTILPGWTDEFDWQGYVPFEELPYGFNPESNTVSSANNRTVGEDYPHYISRWFVLPYRIDRIREMLEEKEKFSIEDFQHMQADQKSKLAELFKDTLFTELKTYKEWNDFENRCLELFSAWDSVVDKHSSAAAMFEQFKGDFLRNVFIDELGEDLYREFISSGPIHENALHLIAMEKGSAWCDDVTTEGIEETFADIVRKSFMETVVALSERMGDNPEKWEWGKVHTLTLEHPLGSVKILNIFFRFNRGPYAVGGSSNTVCPYGYSRRNAFAVTAGASHRHIYSLADWDESLTVIPTGTSGIPASPYYCDQSEMYVENRYHSDFVSKDPVVENARYTMLIKKK
jgi:penicillin amidase